MRLRMELHHIRLIGLRFNRHYSHPLRHFVVEAASAPHQTELGCICDAGSHGGYNPIAP
jgi:hypothetical protein